MPKKKRTKRKYPTRREWFALNSRLTEYWRLAIFELRSQLYDDCLTNPPERRHLQNRRLITNLHAQFGSSADEAESTVLAYCLFCSSPWQPEPGYTVALKQHHAELKAIGISPDLGQSQFKTKPKSDAFMMELLFRLDSLGSWIEAQEAWILWRTLTERPATWDRQDSQARRQAMDATIVARLPQTVGTVSDSFICELIKSFRAWSKPQWVKILEMAARFAERGDSPITELDRWVWWRYPIFMRYHWSASDVCRAALTKFGPTNLLRDTAAFQAAWLRRGLRFRGKRTTRKSPPLWEFVINEEVPRNVPRQLPMLIPYENSSSRA